MNAPDPLSQFEQPQNSISEWERRAAVADEHSRERRKHPPKQYLWLKFILLAFFISSLTWATGVMLSWW